MRACSLSTYLTRLIWWSILPLLLAAAWVIFAHTWYRLEILQQEAQRLTHHFAVAMDEYLIARIGALNVLAASPLVDKPDQWPTVFAEALGFRESFGGHVLLSQPGNPMPMLWNTRVPLGTALPSLPQPPGRSAVATTIQTGLPAVGDSFVGPVAKEPLVAIAVPRKHAGIVTHILLNILSTRQLQRHLDTLDLPETWNVTLRDSSNQLLAHRGSSFSQSQVGSSLSRSFFATSTQFPWSIELVIPGEKIWQPVLTELGVLLLALAAATAVGLKVGLHGGRKLAEQVYALTQPSKVLLAGPQILEIETARRLLDDAATSQHLNQARYQATFEHASIGIAQLTREGLFVQANQTLCTILGYSSDAIQSLPWQQFTPPEALASEQAYFTSLLDGVQESITWEKQCIHRDGTLFWTNMGLTLIRTPDGRPDYFIAIVEQIQARKEAESALRERDAMLEDMAAMAHVGGWHFDPRTGLGQWTPEAARIHDVPEHLPIDTATGLSFFTAAHRPIITEAVRMAIEDAKPYDLELEICSATGRHKWIRTIGHPVLEQGKVIRVQGAIQDITERKTAALALAKSEQQYRILVESANSAIIHWKVDGTICYFNEKAQEIFGWSAQEILGQPVTLLVPAVDSTGIDLSNLIENIANHPEQYRQSINENVRRDGSRIWMSWTNRGMRDEQEQLTGILTVGSDITEFRLIMEELRQRNVELERFDRASVGRELEMIALKRRINELSRQLGQEPPYDLSFIEAIG